MGFNFHSLLKDNDKLKDMPAVSIKKITTDKSVAYNKQKNRLDTIAGNIYEDETYWKLILWANEEYFMEFDSSKSSEFNGFAFCEKPIA